MKGPVKKPHFHVAAGLIQQDGLLLITQRPAGRHLEGLWEFPGGKQETDESLEHCLEREIEEELGMKVRAEKALLTVAHEYRTQMITLHVFGCAVLEGNPESLECQKFRWVKPSHLGEYAFVPADMEVIKLFELRDLIPEEAG